ncbi:MAG: Diguanylate cyclase/phosphodiesterase (GGDEF & EAL domains) with PAS/PAC sensor(S) [uncultured Sulfurovum sp.]|uniref:Diguanylate cyclase/phosphodiesterase (GGDEF & EAL domains) with PAS/PAC sensor(S) n=1 Tax=uncultured Sulfurovum sp. TaxID=269237 RepID=A0A6S6TRG3_9BACT|nr:MAG: Diguanylate cyclase/phosphodiesterase (GGDEF & EAL domains) with PAS/PAC sensor(S) [uncultured Sulfurovum sp.]
MRLKKFTILYVEDEPTTQELIGEILRDSCKEVFVASDGEEGLALYKEKKPDIVLSDIAMPNMNGLDMSEAIKAINTEQAIALFTAFSQPSYLKKAAQLDITTYILKPLDEDQFFNSLNYMAIELETLQEQLERKE